MGKNLTAPFDPNNVIRFDLIFDYNYPTSRGWLFFYQEAEIEPGIQSRQRWQGTQHLNTGNRFSTS
jgi:hypothetical protein